MTASARALDTNSGPAWRSGRLRGVPRELRSAEKLLRDLTGRQRRNPTSRTAKFAAPGDADRLHGAAPASAARPSPGDAGMCRRGDASQSLIRLLAP